MATCKNCLHYKACVAAMKAAGHSVPRFGDDDAHRCRLFEDESRWYRVPIKVDDVVYVGIQEKVFPFEVISVNYSYGSPTFKASHGIHLVWVFGEDDIGRTVFLTRDEAEAELIKRRNKPQTAPDNSEHCVCCGDVIPGGRQVCPKCEKGT